MIGISDNPKAFALFVMGEDESNSPYFEAIPLEQKSVRKFDYQQDLTNLIQTYFKSHDMGHLQQMFEKIVVMGVGFRAVIANEIAHRYGLRALLINPDIGDKTLPFQLTNTQSVHVMIEEDMADFSKQNYEQFFAQAPKNWEVEFLRGDCYGVGGELQMAVADLAECSWAWIDDATWYGED